MLEGCWLWSGPLNTWGYGAFYSNGRTLSAHRAAWETANGPVPDGLFVLHHCDRRMCCNPAHLYLGTQADNMRDKVVRGRYRNAQMMQTAARCGHPFDAHDGRQRYCASCRRAYKAEWARSHRVVTQC